jgi:hypothetical protein
MGNISREARLFFVQLWTLCDDEGRARGDSRMLASLLYPYDRDVDGLIDLWINELDREACLLRYEAEGQTYIQVCNWLIHQKIDKPSRSKIPEFGEGSRILPEPLANPRERSSEDQGRDLRIKEEPSAKVANCQHSIELPAPTPVASLQLVDGSEHGIHQQDVAEWSAAFPAVDVPVQLAQMRAWLKANPTRRKTRKGVAQFVISWLRREQDKGHRLPLQVAPTSQTAKHRERSDTV